MAPGAYVLYCTEIGAQTTSAKLVRQVEGVKDAYPLDGVYDGIAEITADNKDGLEEIAKNIRKVDNVKSVVDPMFII